MDGVLVREANAPPGADRFLAGRSGAPPSWSASPPSAPRSTSPGGGLHTILVLSGVTTTAEVERFPYRPSRIVDSVADLIDDL